MKMKTVIAAMLLTSITAATWADIHEFAPPSTAWSSWGTASNWSPAQIPEATDWARISGGNRVYVPESYSVGSLFVGNSSSGYLRIYGEPNYPGYDTHFQPTTAYIGYAANASGFIQQMGGTVTSDRIIVANAAGSGLSQYFMDGGTLNAARIDNGSNGKAEFLHRAGTVNTDTLYVGLFNYSSHGSDSDVAYYNMTAGTLNVTTNLNLGTFSTGRGHLKMGDDTGATGTIAGAGNMSIRTGNTGGVGILQGFGNVNLTGTLTNSGKVIADGWGGANTSDRTLSMTNFNSISINESTLTADSGWYADNKGKLILPDLTVASGTNTVYFGEDAAGTQNLVNSLKMEFAGVTGGNLPVSLLASDRSELANVEGNIIGVWDVDGSSFDFGTGDVDFTIKYDEALATTLGLTEADLKLYHQVDGSWVDVTTSVDTTNNLITADGIDSFSMFAVGTEIVPEPATLSLVGLGALAALIKRKK